MATPTVNSNQQLRDASLASRGSFSGWTAAGLAPKAAVSSPEQVGMMLRDPSLASRGKEANALNTAPPEVKQQIQEQAAATGQPPTLAGSSAIGWLNYIAQNPVTADQLIPKSGGTKDSALSSRTSLLNPLTGVRETAAQVSTFKSDNAPQAIREQIESLNTNQSLRRALQEEFKNTLMKNAAAGDVYAAEALRATAVQPGASVGFGQRLGSQGEMAGLAAQAQGIGAAAQGAGDLQRQQAAQIAASDANAKKLAELQQRRVQIGSNPMGFYTGSEQEKLDQQIMALQSATSASSPATQRSIAASGVNPSGFSTVGTLPKAKSSGWTSGSNPAWNTGGKLPAMTPGQITY